MQLAFICKLFVVFRLYSTGSPSALLLITFLTLYAGAGIPMMWSPRFARLYKYGFTLSLVRSAVHGHFARGSYL